MRTYLLLVLLMVCLSYSVLALDDSDILNVKVEANDVVLTPNVPKDLKKTDEIKLLIVFDSNVTTENMQVEAVLRGYDHNDLIEDISDVFDVVVGNRYDIRLSLKLPVRMEQGRYDLKIRFDDRTGPSYEIPYALDIGAPRHMLEIKDIVLSPENEVEAGRALLASVRVKNRGESKEEDIKVRIIIPELGLSASDYIDELAAEGEDDDSKTSEELYLRIPICADEGTYRVIAEIIYDDGDEKVTKETTIRVVPSELCVKEEVKPEVKTIISIGPEIQDITKGSTGIYPLTITNAGTDSRRYVIEADTGDWATFEIAPTNLVIIEPGKTKSLYIKVTPKDTAIVGENLFVVTVKSDEDVLKEVTLKANVIEKKPSVPVVGWERLKKGLEIALIILVVLLVILGLIIGFSKLRREEEEGKEEEETYY